MGRMLIDSHTRPDITTRVIQKAKAFGASLAGIASISSIQSSPSYGTCGKVEWPLEAKSLLVLALAHETSGPELDWWDNKKGGSPGNRRLGNTAKCMIQCLNEKFHINARLLPYHVEKGGVFLKDAAALAGLGTIGKNNLLITPELGPRVRFRALLLDAGLEPTGPIDFAPCEACDMACGRICPQKAFETGSYSRPSCNEQMKEDEINKVIFEKSENNDSPTLCIKYCRACELACPVAR